MARWQLTKLGVPTDDVLFDDGNPQSPGDEGFSTDSVKAQLAALPGADSFNFVGASLLPDAA